ncbi:unnamed protein product [Polarella glacialis]|uniref:Phosphodiesterase n=1 Tax=Polarella glacialis TaxID=89957 RepID=A0A813KFD1_POLGL|nr:unnamed protein product [Polarella glacialis]CAE8700450.1 unnamed protein product [Polarella glacialis]
MGNRAFAVLKKNRTDKCGDEVTGMDGLIPQKLRQLSRSESESRRAVPRHSNWVGSYASLATFVNECQSWLPEERYNKLMDAVDDLGTRSGGISGAVSYDTAHFEGHMDDFNSVMFGPTKSYTFVHRKLLCTDFDCLRVGKNLNMDASTIACAFACPFDLVGKYSIDNAVLVRWIATIASMYLDNPYHSWRHAYDVFQFSYFALSEGAGSRFFNYHDMLALMISAIAHDVGHTGTNNSFLVQTRSPLALTYNDRSPMENMHASVLFETLTKPGLNVLSGLSTDAYTKIRAKMIEAILATDMAHHFEFVDQLTARTSHTSTKPFLLNVKFGGEERENASRADRRMLLTAFLHTADLGHTLRPWDVHKNLVVLLEEEFFLQGDRQRDLEMNIMPMMDRTKDSVASSQAFFLEKLVRPLVEPFTLFLSVDAGIQMLANLEDNAKHWAKLLEKHLSLFQAYVFT